MFKKYSKEHMRWLDEAHSLLGNRVFSKDFKTMAQIEREREQKFSQLNYMVNLPLNKPEIFGGSNDGFDSSL